MAWTKTDKKYWEDILAFEETLYKYEPNDLEKTYVKWVDQGFSMLPENLQEQFFEKLDSWLFHLHSLLQGSQIQNDARERILGTARIFDDDIQSISDLKKLNIDKLHYIAEQHAARHRVYSLIQGGIAGTGGPIAIGTDFLALAIMNLRAVQLTGMSYGYDVQTPFEMMSSLKVFHVATLPARMKSHGWEELKQQAKESYDYFYSGNEQLTNNTWLDEPLKQVIKAMFIQLFRKRLISGLPFISMAIGASVNYQVMRKVTTFSEKYYQFRYLTDKEGRLL
ncbi:EcsC family protein [Falsibacillus pallidus]|uniref:EcsC family protein n=1 Tax=Falsibacillus pallidus TaxID=493781 RepID=A0A370GQN4_9BACI|nr:EcsC family protein [Falsibacillus pallidus]RDI44273.1 EcsC family protein [Falsibacillus pallidus]